MIRSDPIIRSRPRHVSANDLARMHQSALPRCERPHDGFALACWSRPVGAIGGDVLAAWAVDARRMIVCLADVMGHDMPAAIVASSIRAGLHAARRNGSASPAAILSGLDQAVAELFEGYFVTASVCLLDLAGTLTWAQAGHPPVLVRESSGQVSRLSARALPLGLSGREPYTEQRVSLAHGSTALLYSDGVCDALAPDDGSGLELLEHAIGASPSPAPTPLIRRIRKTLRAGGKRREDDCSLLAVQMLNP